MIKFLKLFFAYVLFIGCAWANSVDVNTASLQELDSIKGIGPKMATLIIEARKNGGNFKSYSDLAERVKGLGLKKIKSLRIAGLEIKGAVDEDLLPQTEPKKSKSKKRVKKIDPKNEVEMAVPRDTFPKLVRPPKF